MLVNILTNTEKYDIYIHIYLYIMEVLLWQGNFVLSVESLLFFQQLMEENAQNVVIQ